MKGGNGVAVRVETEEGAGAGLPVSGAKPSWGSLRWQGLAIVLALLLGLALVMNNQMSGDAVWFWYGVVLHHGVRLYADLHVPLQPLFILLTDWWMALVGHRLFLTQMPSLFEILAMCLGLLLVLRESRWSDATKAVMLLGAFCLIVFGQSYRFDDYHALAENLMLYAFWLLLVIARVDGRRPQLLLVATVGVLNGLLVTTRLTDGAALFAAAVVCLVVLLGRRRWVGLLVFAGGIAASALTVVLLTGDTLHDYLRTSVLRAAESKGGTGNVVFSPLVALVEAPKMLAFVGKRATILLALVIGFQWILRRYGRLRQGTSVLLQVAFVAAVVLLVPATQRFMLSQGIVVKTVVLWLIPPLYLLTPVVLLRLLLARKMGWRVDRREVVVIVPLAQWCSYAAAAGGEPLTNYYVPIALLLLLVPVLGSARSRLERLEPALTMLLLLIIASTAVTKYLVPYRWQNYRFPQMFTNRVWFTHPVYGPMYIDRQLLSFSSSVCHDIHAEPGKTAPALLSVPYPYPNYFCDTPPWHDYVQTFFDTSTHATVEAMVQGILRDPPRWIVYQRQSLILKGAERLYNHGQRLPQRDLDTLIRERLADGQWLLVEKSNYLNSSNGGDGTADDGWFVIDTHGNGAAAH